MASTITRSPPTSSVSEARSCVVATTLSFDWAPTGAPRQRTNTSHDPRGVVLIATLPRKLEGMGSMHSDRKLELEQRLVGVLPLCVARSAKLSANLTELARPVGEDQ